MTDSNTVTPISGVSQPYGVKPWKLKKKQLKVPRTPETHLRFNDENFKLKHTGPGWVDPRKNLRRETQHVANQDDMFDLEVIMIVFLFLYIIVLCYTVIHVELWMVYKVFDQLVNAAKTASLWFVWVRFGSRKVNEPEIGSVSVCIPTVCFVESKLMDAVWPPYAILIGMGMGSTPKSGVHSGGLNLGSEFNPEKLCSEMKGTSQGLNQDVGPSSTPKSRVQR